MNKARPLIEVVPVYKFKNPLQCEHDSPFRQSDWIDNRKALGDKGELLVKEFLEVHYNATVEPQPDSAGYDFKVRIDDKISYVEVKTTTRGLNTFFMSHNEVKVAKQKGTNYYLYFVCLDNNVGTLHIILNPFDTLELDKLFEITNTNDLASVSVGSIEIKILDLSKLLEEKDFFEIGTN